MLGGAPLVSGSSRPAWDSGEPASGPRWTSYLDWPTFIGSALPALSGDVCFRTLSCGVAPRGWRRALKAPAAEAVLSASDALCDGEVDIAFGGATPAIG